MPASSPDTGLDDFKLVRTLIMKDYGVNIGQALDEIFKGRLVIKGKTIELTGLPSTVITKGCNVTIASQIFMREYEEPLYKNITTYSAFYRKFWARMKELKNNAVWFWAGAPSFVFSYKNRMKFKHSCVRGIFYPIPYGSTKCVIDSQLDAMKDDSYCERYDFLENKCTDKEYLKSTTHSKLHRKFITDFKQVIPALQKEQAALDAKKGKNSVMFYNEMLSYFFPWDVIGIEIGGMSANVTNRLLNQFNARKRAFVKDITAFMEKADDEILKTVEVCKINIRFSKINAIDDSLFIFVKFLTLCGCEGCAFGIHDIRFCVRTILDLLKTPIKLYEYGRPSHTSHFRLTELPALRRTTKFELFTRIVETPTPSVRTSYMIPAQYQLRTETLATNHSVHKTRRRPKGRSGRFTRVQRSTRLL